MKDKTTSVYERRYDIDWIRVIVFDLLIFYHVIMFFVDWDFHIKNNEIVYWIESPMLFLNQWRLPILFVISGIGTRFAMNHRSGLKYIKERLSRLLIPLIAGILIIVPPQVYIERISQGFEYNSYLSFYPDFFNGIYPTGNFSYHHLWFIAYLLTMSLLATPLFLYLRKEGNSFIKLIKRKVEHQPLFLYVPILFFLIPEYTLKSFPATRAFIDDWYAWSVYSLCFIIGFVLICMKETFWKALNKVRYLSLAIGILSFSILITHAGGKQFHDSIYPWIPILKVTNMWTWILAIFAWSARFLNKKNNLILQRNNAVYPFYIVHQTIIIFFGYLLMDVQMHYGFKMLIMVVATFFLSWIIYKQIIMRFNFLKPLFGVKV